MNNGEVTIQYGPVFDSLPDITLQGGGGAGYQGEQNYGGGGAGYQGGNPHPDPRIQKIIDDLNKKMKLVNLKTGVVMKHKIEPKSWKKVAKSLDAVDHEDVLQLYEEGREDELEAYYENAVWSKLSRVTNHVEQVERRVNAIRNRVGVPYEENGDAWSWLRSLKTSMTTAWFVVVFNLILTLVLAVKVL